MTRFTVALLLASTSFAFAADEPRKIDFTLALTDQDGEAMTECADNPPAKSEEACKARRLVTLGTVSMRALAFPEQNLSPEESLKRGQLAISIYKSTAAQLTVEETALIKKQISKFFGPIVVLRTFSLLDPAVK